MLERRDFFKVLGGTVACLNYSWAQASEKTTITDIQVVSGGPREKRGVRFTTHTGVTGFYRGSPQQDIEYLATQTQTLKKLFIGKDPHDRTLSGELVWETLHPGKAMLYAKGIDPLTGEPILAKDPKKRAQRHSKTNRIFMAFSTVDNALWDLRGKLLNKPVHYLMGDVKRTTIPVYWRPGEAKDGLTEARKRARDAFEKGFKYQKWYFTKSAEDGDKGFKENVDLVRVLREELPDAHLMFDNHSIRYYTDVDYSIKLCKAVAEYKPFWIEEPIHYSHVDGYARIKGESGVVLAGGEHWFTRWQVQPFLDRGCLDYLQVDPVWCGGITEWLKICALARKQPGLKVVPHTTSPHTLAMHCAASQPESFSPLAEYNSEGGRKYLEKFVRLSDDGQRVFQLPTTPGICT